MCSIVSALTGTFLVLRQDVPSRPDDPSVCPWSPGQTLGRWLLPRVLEPVYTAWDLEPFARDCGHEGAPYTWDPDRRFQAHCQLDAAFFHLQGLSRADTEYVLGTFPITRR